MRIIPAILALSLIMAAPVWPAEREQVGPLPGGRFLLNSGWVLEPAGRQTPVDSFPMASALSPDGRWLLVLNGGFNPPSISVLEAATGKETGRTPVADGWLGMVFSPTGDRVYVGGGSQAAVFEFAFAQGALRASRTFAVVPAEKRTGRDFIGDVALSPDGRMLYAADLFRDSVVVINPQSGMVVERFRTGRRPYRILFHPDGRSLFVTSWADGSVGHYETVNGKRLANVRLGPHPTDMVWRTGKNDPQEGETEWAARLFVAAANTNSFYTVGVTASKEMELAEVVNVSPAPGQPLGLTPSALALDPKGDRLYVVCSDANAVAVVDVEQDRSSVMGFVPVGWYPTAARALPDGTLVVLNGKGGGSRQNPGTASFIPPFGERQLDAYTRTVLANSAYREERLSAQHKLPPVRHVVYIVTGSRSYDQVFGGAQAPNHQKLAREFALLDNFHTNGDTSADGYAWAAAAIAPAFVQRMSPGSGRGRPAAFDGQEPAAWPPAGYIWTNAHSAGLSVRNYGHFVVNRPGAALKGTQVDDVRDPVLARLTNRSFRGPDPNYPDAERAQVFVEEMAEYEKTGQMPQLILMRLGGRDIADADLALGKIVEAVSRSRFWGETAILVIPTDAREGGGNQDSHRAPAFAISPWVKRGSVDGSMYNTASVLRTIGLLLGLRPMTQFDAAARPMTALFAAAPDTAPYEAARSR
jgi:DNA-binding beta-propeller fold protein YncE